ncbi:MAG TPA: MFS transporter [Candidatus Binataceae bacterium]|nr:MFS transporter [Candidatus Binataceae bacterium]
MEAVLKDSSTIKGILRRYYAVWLMFSFAGGFLFGVYPIFLKSRGLSQFEINSVLATYFIVLFFTDVPTGAFADALGRRRSFVAGTLLRVTAFITYFFAHHYYVFLIAESIDGIGTTFCNGAIDAWGVDALDEAGYDELKDRLFSRISQLSSAAFMCSAMVGAYIADINIAWPWLFGATGYLLSCIVGARLMKGETPRNAHLDLRSMPRHIVEQMGGAVQLGFKTETVLWLSFAGAISFAAWAPYWLEWPIMFNERFNVGVWIIGWIYSGLTLARMIGAEITIRFASDEYARVKRVTTLVVFASLMLFLAGVFGHRPMLSLAMLFAMNVATGGMQPLLQSWFNEQIESNQRATLLSFSSTFGTLGGSIGLLAGGVIADTSGIPFEWQIAGLISLVAAPVYWSLRPRATVPVGVTASD